jgi:hypothetical protein
MGTQLINLESNIKAMLADFNDLTAKVQGQAVRRALNRTADTGRTRIVKEVRTLYRLRAKDIRDRITIRRASGTELEVRIRASGNRLPLVSFDPRQVGSKTSRRGTERGGVSVNIKGSRKLIKGAFIATMSNGHRGVYQRRGLGRLPIDELYTISIPEMIDNRRVSEVVLRALADEMPRRLLAELNYRRLRGNL